MKKVLAVVFTFVLVLGMLPANVAAEAEEQDVKVIISGGTDIDETQDNPDGEPGDGQEGNDDNPDGEPGDGQEGNDDNPDGEPGDGQEGNDDNPDGEPGDGQDDNDDDPDPGLLPDSPFYFFKRFIENVKVWFTFDDGRKTDLLSELVEKRALELEALEEKYAEDEELSEKQKDILTKAAQELEETAEDVFERLVGEGEDEELEELELTEEGFEKLETALENLGKALDTVEKCDEDCDKDKEQDREREQKREQKMLEKMEKYQHRIEHLERIRDCNPESAANGLNRAIENARRQRARWAAKNGIELEDVDEDQGEGEGENTDHTIEVELQDIEHDDEENTDKAWNKKDKDDKSNKGNNGNNGNNGRGNNGNNGNNGRGNNGNNGNNGRGN